MPQGRIVMPLWVTTACNLQHCHNSWFGWAHCFCCNTSKHKRLKICQHYVTQSAGSTVCTCMVSTCRRPQGNRILYQHRGRRVPGHFPGYLRGLANGANTRCNLACSTLLATLSATFEGSSNCICTIMQLVMGAGQPTTSTP